MSIIKKTKANSNNPDSPSGKRLNLTRKKISPEISRINLPLSEIILPHPSPRVFTPGETVSLGRLHRAGGPALPHMCPGKRRQISSFGRGKAHARPNAS